MIFDCDVVHSIIIWVSNSLKGNPFECNLDLQLFKGLYFDYYVQFWFIGVRFFKVEGSLRFVMACNVI